MKKDRLDLTIKREFKALARKLAVRRRRSISGLFEDLVEEEDAREKEKKAFINPSQERLIQCNHSKDSKE